MALPRVRALTVFLDMAKISSRAIFNSSCWLGVIFCSRESESLDERFSTTRSLSLTLFRVFVRHSRARSYKEVNFMNRRGR